MDCGKERKNVMSAQIEKKKEESHTFLTSSPIHFGVSGASGNMMQEAQQTTLNTTTNSRSIWKKVMPCHCFFFFFFKSWGIVKMRRPYSSKFQFCMQTRFSFLQFFSQRKKKGKKESLNFSFFIFHFDVQYIRTTNASESGMLFTLHHFFESSSSNRLSHSNLKITLPNTHYPLQCIASNATHHSPHTTHWWHWWRRERPAAPLGPHSSRRWTAQHGALSLGTGLD